MFDKLRRRNALIVMQRTENKQQGRPTYAGTGRRKRGGCPLLTLIAAGIAAHTWATMEIGRWMS